jgi:hypothetical protein
VLGLGQELPSKGPFQPNYDFGLPPATAFVSVMCNGIQVFNTIFNLGEKYEKEREKGGKSKTKRKKGERKRRKKKRK